MPKITIVEDIDKKTLKQEYQDAITRLAQIENVNPTGTTSQILALTVTAVKDMARVLRLLLIVVAKKYFVE